MTSLLPSSRGAACAAVAVASAFAYALWPLELSKSCDYVALCVFAISPIGLSLFCDWYAERPHVPSWSLVVLGLSALVPAVALFRPESPLSGIWLLLWPAAASCFVLVYVSVVEVLGCLRRARRP